MNKISKVVLVAIILVLGVFLVSFGLGKKKATTTQPVRIASVPWIGNGVYFVAQDQGFFAKENVTVEFVSVDNTATGKQLLNTGNIDALYLTPETVVVLQDAGVKVKVFAANDLSFGADGIVAAANIQSVEDLKGKTVAFEVGSPSHFLLSYLLNQKGLSTKDLKVVDSIAPDAGAAFVAGKVDAAVTWEPWLTQATQRSGGHLLVSSRNAPVIFDMPIFRADVADRRPQDIKALLRGVFAAQQWILGHRSEAAAIIAQHLKISPQEAMDQMEGVQWQSYEENMEKLTAGEYSIKNSIQAAGDLWLKLGLIKTKIDASDIVDPSLLKTLYQ